MKPLLVQPVPVPLHPLPRAPVKSQPPARGQGPAQIPSPQPAHPALIDTQPGSVCFSQISRLEKKQWSVMGKINGTRNDFKPALAALYVEESFKENRNYKSWKCPKIKTSEHMELQPDYLPVQREPDKGFDAPHLKELKTRISHRVMGQSYSLLTKAYLPVNPLQPWEQAQQVLGELWRHVVTAPGHSCGQCSFS